MRASNLNREESLEFLDWLYWKPAEARTRGVDVLHLLGSPRNDPPQHVIEAGIRATSANRELEEYGLPEFRQAAAATLARDGVVLDWETEIVATNGGYNAVFVALASLLDGGDEAIFPTPEFYYWNSVQILNAVPVFAPTSERDRWAWDVEAIEASVTPRTRAIVITNPCNPTGFMAERQHLEALAEVVLKHDLVVVEDQAYQRFTHTPKRITSAASLPQLRERTLISYSFHKNYSLHAWRAGFVAGPRSLIEPLLNVAVWINLRINHVTQSVAAAAMAGPQEWVDDVVVAPYREGHRILREGLAGDEGITMKVPSEGGTMGLLNVDGLGLPSREVATRLLFDYGVPTVPLSAFGPARDSGESVRIPFAINPNQGQPYEEVLSRLRDASVALRPAPAVR